MQTEPTVGPLTKISLSFDVLEIDSNGRPIRTGVPFEFVYGIGTEGLSVFETKLHGLEARSRVRIRITKSTFQSTFEHLGCALLDALNIQPPFDLDIEVRSVSPVTERELIHALANKDPNGCACDCGCSCSG